MSSGNTHKSKSKPTTFLIRDKFVHTVWIGRANEKLVSGQRVVNELFSLESFVATAKPEHQTSKALAKKMIPSIKTFLTATETELKESITLLQNELDEVLKDPIYSVISIGGGTHSYEQKITIEANIAWPLVNQFIKTFVLIDVITEKLREMYKMGVITFSEYKGRQRDLLKPIWKCMTKIDEAVRKFHSIRKDLDKKENLD